MDSFEENLLRFFLHRLAYDLLSHIIVNVLPSAAESWSLLRKILSLGLEQGMFLWFGGIICHMRPTKYKVMTQL